MPGPVPKSSEQRRRRRSANELPGPDVAPAGAEVVWPEADPEWHPIASRWYESLANSGQSVLYQESDVATAVYVAEAMSRNLTDGKFSAMLFQSVNSAATELMTTEGSRRRLRLELARGPQVDEDEVAADATVTSLRSRLGG